MSIVRAILAVAAVVLVVGPARAEDHIVAAGTAGERLAAAAASREHDLAAVQDVLATPAAAAAAARWGVDLRRVQDAVPTLGDEELADLAQRTSKLHADPAAGLDPDIHDLLIIFLVVAIVIVVIKAVD
jgi:hypothetical protein